jgi:hypothetical protein
MFDTTLRDGAQTEGVAFTLADKLKVTGRSTSSAFVIRSGQSRLEPEGHGVFPTGRPI